MAITASGGCTVARTQLPMPWRGWRVLFIHRASALRATTLRTGVYGAPAIFPRSPSGPCAETQPHHLIELVVDLALLAPATTTWPLRLHRATLTLAVPAARLVHVVRAVG